MLNDVSSSQARSKKHSKQVRHDPSVKIETSIKKANLTYSPNAIFKCSKDSVLFENSLLQSLTLSDSNNKITLINQADKRNREVKDYREILSAKVPGHLSLDTFYLPFIKLSTHDPNTNEFATDSNKKTTFELYATLLAIFIFILLSVVITLCIHLKAKNDLRKS